MKRSAVILLLFGCFFLMIPPIIFLSTSSESSQVTVGPVIEVNTEPITAGVILVNAAAGYGWSGGDYAETTVNGNRVIVYDNLNATARPDVRLQDVVSGMIERGAQVIFISPGYVADAGEIRVDEQYPNIVFIMNLAARAEVESLLLGLSSGAAAVPVNETTQPQMTSSTEDRGPVFVLIIAVIIALGVALFMSSRWQSISFRPDPKAGKKKRAHGGLHAKALMIEDAARARATDFDAMGELPPVIHEFSTFVNGDTHFDESFAIELNREFLGQCGMGPSEAISRYDREKIAAFEVWLFDKNDIRTMTTVLMSEHAYDDSALKARLQSKGELLLAETDAVAVLETQTLRIRARVLDMQYGFSDTLPQRSFFEHLVVEIAAWQK